ncbi:hypothetical protein [Chitinophaga sp. MM2321]|uniref:hypothetical protein n=1 Tax=Chitinophaga sp. MM2321 TaxID=3137178 RepID=UPI0032D58497
MTTTLKTKTLLDRVLVKPVSTDERTTGGIIISDTAKEKSPQDTSYSGNPLAP